MPTRRPTPRSKKTAASASSKAAPRAKPKPKPASPTSQTFPITLRGSLLGKFLDAAKAAELSPEDYGALMIDNGVSPVQLTDHAKRHAAVARLVKLISTLPGVHKHVGLSRPDDWFWWVKFSIDPGHDLAWHVIQRLGWVFNSYSLEERFFTKFTPVSPPPYLNGGPHEYLSWVIEATIRFYDPRPVTEALRLELPSKVTSAAEWREFDNDA